MRPSLIIPRLKEACPIFGGRVAGAASAAKAMENAGASLTVPQAFVVPLTESLEGTLLSPLQQETAQNFAVVVCVSNLSDERGQGSVEDLFDARDQIIAALLGWNPSAEHGVCLYQGMPDDPYVDRARAWAQFDFQATTSTTQAD